MANLLLVLYIIVLYIASKSFKLSSGWMSIANHVQTKYLGEGVKERWMILHFLSPNVFNICICLSFLYSLREKGEVIKTLCRDYSLRYWAILYNTLIFPYGIISADAIPIYLKAIYFFPTKGRLATFLSPHCFVPVALPFLSPNILRLDISL